MTNDFETGIVFLDTAIYRLTTQNLWIFLEVFTFYSYQALVNKAGISDPFKGPIQELSLEGWQKQSERQAPDLREIDHQQHLTGRVGYPPDIAGLTAFLLSEQAGFITGQAFIVDGVMTKRMIYEE
ncbi:MAG: SDR family oxidoreductase [Bacteroidetes bacterium]|jgi:NAD(P)-dependent dehydrogenase (short-subunit alcohol dehydrogenase family)|nr:SDR family oxidoreductase [Bacteroidota bacterium]